MNFRLIVLSLFFFLFFSSVFAFAGGTGTQQNPYQVADCNQLQSIHEYASSGLYFTLKSNIDCAATSNWNDKNGFKPIGCGVYSTYRGYSAEGFNGFNGFLDGNNFTISNLFISKTDFAGLFCAITGSGVVKNVKLVNHNITGNIVVGSLAAFNQGSIINVQANGNVYIKYPFVVSPYVNYIGGLVGENRHFNPIPTIPDSSGFIINSYSQGTVGYSATPTCLPGNSYTRGGGLSGSNVGGSIINSYSTGQINLKCHTYVGGLIGDTLKGFVFNNYSTKSVIGVSSVGGLVGLTSGRLGNESFLYNYSSGSVTGTYGVGGLIGAGGGEIAYNYSSGTVTGISSLGGLVGGLRTGMPVSGPAYIARVHNNYSKSSINLVSGGVGSGMTIGGLVGEVEDSFIYNNYSTQSFSGYLAGGLVGEVRCSKIFNNYSLGSISLYGSNLSYFDMGGFLGTVDNTDPSNWGICPKEADNYYEGDSITSWDLKTAIINNASLGTTTIADTRSDDSLFEGDFISTMRYPTNISNNWWLGTKKVGRCFGLNQAELASCDSSNGNSYSSGSQSLFKSNNTYGPYPNWDWQNAPNDAGDWVVNSAGCVDSGSYPILSFQLNGACGAASYLDLNSVIPNWYLDDSLLCARGSLQSGSFVMGADGYDANWICDSPFADYCGGISVSCTKWTPPCTPVEQACTQNRDCCSGLCSSGVCSRSCSLGINTDCPSYCNSTNDFGCSCGNGVCDAWENTLTCPNDCPVCSLQFDNKCPSYCNSANDYDCSCGNDIIESWENCRNCPTDVVCGDGNYCDFGVCTKRVTQNFAFCGDANKLYYGSDEFPGNYSYCENSSGIIIDFNLDPVQNSYARWKCIGSDGNSWCTARRIESAKIDTNAIIDLIVSYSNDMLFVSVLCSKDTIADLSLLDSNGALISIDQTSVPCNSTYSTTTLTPVSSLAGGEVYSVDAFINNNSPDCSVCSKTTFFNAPGNTPSSVPDNSFIFIFLILIVSIFIIKRNSFKK